MPYGFGIVVRQGITVRIFRRTNLFLSWCNNGDGGKEGDRGREREEQEGDRVGRGRKMGYREEVNRKGRQKGR